MARIECGFTCKDCLSFEKCSYDAYKEANLNGKSEQNLISIADRLSCKFFKNKEDYEKVRNGECLICNGEKDIKQDCDNGYYVEIDREQWEMSVWLGDECLAVFSIDYCPNCGAKMDRKGD